MDLTNATLPELKARKKEVEDMISNGLVSTQLIDERNMLSNRIAEMGGNEEEIEEEDETARVIARANEEIEVFGVPFGAYISDIADHISLRTVVLAKVRQLQNDAEELKNSLRADSEAYEQSIFTLQKALEERDSQIAELKAGKYEAELLAEDNATKRDNAYNELLEAKRTIDELNDKLTAANTVKAPVITNLDGAVPVKKEKRVIYAVEYQGRRNEKFTAKYADTDESFEDYSIYKDNKYTEVTQAEADTFRSSYLEQHPAPVVEEEVQVEPTAPPIREEDSTGSELVTEAPAVAGEVSREEFNALEERISALEERFYL